MACKGSGVQIPSAPPQVRGRVPPRPPSNLGPQAANRQQAGVVAGERRHHEVRARRGGIMLAQIPSIVANPAPSSTWSATAVACR
jgi:hypothetical protein